jgi:hypothetical protein
MDLFSLFWRHLCDSLRIGSLLVVSPLDPVPYLYLNRQPRPISTLDRLAQDLKHRNSQAVYVLALIFADALRITTLMTCILSMAFGATSFTADHRRRLMWFVIWDWELGELEKTAKSHTSAITVDYGGPKGPNPSGLL